MPLIDVPTVEYALPSEIADTTELSLSSRRGQRHRIEVSRTIASHGVSERSNSDKHDTATPDEKRSNTPSKLRSEINDVVHDTTMYKYI